MRADSGFLGQGSCCGSCMCLDSKGMQCSYPFCTFGYAHGVLRCVFILVTNSCRESKDTLEVTIREKNEIPSLAPQMSKMVAAGLGTRI